MCHKYEDNFITEYDLDNIKSLGFNCVRVPFWFRNFYYDDGGRKILDENGEWKPVEATVTPDWPFSDEVFFQPHNGEFIFSFPAVTTTAVRVIGDDALLVHWHKYTKDVSAFISITELQVYEAK